MSTILLISTIGYVAFAGTQTSTINSVFPPPSIDLGSFPGGVTLTFILELSGSFVNWPGLHYGFPVALITGRGGPRNSPEELLHSRHTLAYLRCGEAIPFLHGNLNQSPLLTPPFLSQPVVGLKSQKQEVGGWRWGIWLQFSGLLAVSPGRSTLPSEPKTSRPSELKILGTGGKKNPTESLEVTVSGTISFFHLLNS